MVELLLSGGQTGADRGGLDAAIELGIPHGGWCPKGRKAADGIIPAIYVLQETRSAGYPSRTSKNIDDADATIVFAPLPPTPGSQLTLNLVQGAGKPHLHVVLEEACDLPDLIARSVTAWLKDDNPNIRILNVAGSRDAFGSTRVQTAVCEIMLRVLRNVCDL